MALNFRVLRVNWSNFTSHGWATEHILRGADPPTPDSPYVGIHCPPLRNNASRFYGAVGMQLVPLLNFAMFPLMRRVRLNNKNQTHALYQISVLRYMTLVIPIIDTMGRPNLAPGLVLRIISTVNNQTQTANIFFNPSDQLQPVLVNQWQEWDALQGYWRVMGDPPNMEPSKMADIIQRFPSARLHNHGQDPNNPNNDGQGAIRFTIGGPNNRDYALFFHYVDRFMINRRGQPEEILIYDFDC